MAELTAAPASRHPDRPALIDEFGERTWSELNARVDHLIGVIADMGLNRGDVVAVMSGNRRELFEVFLAGLHTGLVVVPVNWHWTRAELSYVLADSGARALFVDARFGEVAAGARMEPSTSQVARWVALGGNVEGFEDLETLLSNARTPSDPPGESFMGGPMFYTSGTTGFPKGVRGALVQPDLPTGVISLIAAGMCGQLTIPADGVTLLTGPAYHSAQWVFSMMPLITGSTVVMRHRFDAAETLGLIDAHGVTNLHLVPTQMSRLCGLNSDVRAAFDGSSLQVVYHGAAPCPTVVKRDLLAWWGPIVTEYYGGTEAGFLTAISGAEWTDRPTSVGRVMEGSEITVLDDEGAPCPPDTTGQIWFRSTRGSRFEYHGDPDKTASTHREGGWATLGDVGRLDADGYLHLTDRRIDMIISGGVNIYPAEVEGVLFEHPGVQDAAVFGIPHPDMGEQVHALVQPAPGAHPSSEELVVWCRERLASQKCPRAIEIVDELPRTPTGKLLKRQLRDPYWEGTGRTM